VIADVARSIGVGDGNLAKALANVALLSGATSFAQGTVVAGESMRELEGLLRSCGLTYSIQDGTLQFLTAGKALDGTAILLNSDTGLVGVPAIDHKKVLSFQTLMIPDLFPGRKVKLDAEEIKGYFVVQKAKYQGESRGLPWYIHCEAKAL
jgi:hypothetical protein